MSRGCSGEKTKVRKRFAPGLGCSGGGGGGSQEEAEAEAAGTGAETREKRRRCGFSYKMAVETIWKRPPPRPRARPAPGTLGLVVSQRPRLSQSLGRVGLRDRDSQQGVRGPAPARRPERPRWVQSQRTETCEAGLSSARSRALRFCPRRAVAPTGGCWGIISISHSRGRGNGSKIGVQGRHKPPSPRLATRWRPLSTSAPKSQPPLPCVAGSRFVPTEVRGGTLPRRAGPPSSSLARWFLKQLRASPGRLDKTGESTQRFCFHRAGVGPENLQI